MSENFVFKNWLVHYYNPLYKNNISRKKNCCFTKQTHMRSFTNINMAYNRKSVQKGCSVHKVWQQALSAICIGMLTAMFWEGKRA